MEKFLGKSWRTSLFGKGGLLTILGFIANAYLDGDPTTNVDWAVTLPALLAVAGLIFARDHKVTSEEAGAKPKE